MKAFTESFTFKTAKLDSPALTNIQSLLDKNLLADTDIEEQKDDAGATIGFKRKNITAQLTAPDMASVLEGSELTPAAIATIQQLIQNQVGYYNKINVVDEGGKEYASWEQVLEAGLAVRKASSKVTQDMVKETTGAFVAFMRDVLNAQPNGLELAERLATRKFSVSICNKVPEAILERFSGVIGRFSEELDALELEKHLPVLEVWASELEKTLNPVQDDLTVDLLGDF